MITTKQEIHDINVAVADKDRLYKQGLITRLEYAQSVLALEESRCELIAAAFDAGELEWALDPEQALQASDDHFAEVDTAYHKGFNDAMAKIAIANGETKFNP